MRVAVGLAALLSASTASADEAPICADRPSKANAVCTVAAGTWQIETSLVDWQKLEQGDGETETLMLGSSVLKLGLTERSELQLALTPIVRVSSNGQHDSSFGDMQVRYKHRVTRTDSPVQVALIPFIKLPTARTGIGNGKAEAGLALPVSVALGAATMTFGPEVDVLADADGHGRHLGIVQLVNLSATVLPRLALGAEIWANWNFDPQGTVRQSSLDFSVAYTANADLQLDVGANLGLGRYTPDVQFYAGVSKRF